MSAMQALVHGLRGGDLRVVTGDGSLTDAALGDRVRRIVDELGPRGATCVASCLDNGPDWLALDLALRVLGAVHVPLPTFFSAEQTAHALDSSGAEILVGATGTPPPTGASTTGQHALAGSLSCWQLAGHPHDVPESTACITYTSGTTGRPKGVCLSEAAMLAVAHSLADASRVLSPSRHLCLMPLSTLLENVSGLYAALTCGAQIVVPPLAEIGYTGATGLDIATLLACLHRYQPHSVILLPQLLLALVTAAEQGRPPPASLRFIAVGGGRIGPRLLARAAALGLPVYEGYGLTECASVVCLNRPGAQRPGSVGQALPHARVTAVDGELMVDGVRCIGYLGEAGPPAGAIATGDLGHVDDDGFVHVTGRRKNVFITAFGRNVSPEWVESELLQHPAFAQALVCGEARPHNIAVLVTRAADLDDKAIRRALEEVNAGLPDYARIGDFVRADQPFSAREGLLTSNGRPRREAILARYAPDIARRYDGTDQPLPHEVIA